MKSTRLPSSIFIILQSVRIILPIFQKGEAAYLSACLKETKINSINLMFSRKGTAYLNYSVLWNINSFPRNSCVPDLAKSIHNWMNLSQEIGKWCLYILSQFFNIIELSPRHHFCSSTPPRNPMAILESPFIKRVNWAHHNYKDHHVCKDIICNLCKIDAMSQLRWKIV